MRKQNGISQEKLAEILEVSSQQMYKYENGINKVSIDKLSKVAKHFNVNLDFFNLLKTHNKTEKNPNDEERTLKILKNIDDRHKKLWLEIGEEFCDL